MSVYENNEIVQHSNLTDPFVWVRLKNVRRHVAKTKLSYIVFMMHEGQMSKTSDSSLHAKDRNRDF